MINKVQVSLENGKVKVAGKRVSTPIEYRIAVAAIRYGTVGGYDSEQIELFENCLFSGESIAESISDAKTKLAFLRESIFILRETGRKFIDEPYKLQDLTRLYWKEYINAKKQQIELDPKEPANACENYFGLCDSDANQDWFERRGLNREDEMCDLSDELLSLKKNDKNMGADHRREREQAIAKTRRWLLLRYNLTQARKIAYHDNAVSYYLAAWLPEVVAFVILAIIFCPLFRRWAELLMFNRFGWEMNGVIGSFYLLAFLLFVLMSGQLASRKREIAKRPDLQVHLPRMAAGILVGYLVLLNDEAWAGVFGLKLWPVGVGRMLIPLLAVGLYILIEMNNVSGIGIRSKVWKKAWLLLIRGASYAALFGIMVSDLFGSAIIERVAKGKNILEPMPGLFGIIYPEVLYLLSPMALFIGILIQLLWEDKSLTEKI